MKYKNLLTVVAVASAVIFLPGVASAAGYSDHYQDYATVTHVEPVVDVVQVSSPRRECWNEYVANTHGQGRRDLLPEGVGAATGAVIGNLLGKGHRDRDWATLAGAALGGASGHVYKKRQQVRHGDGHYVERCREVSDYRSEERVVGYDVTYRYNGRTYQTRTNQHPGDSLPVNVSVTPQ